MPGRVGRRTTRDGAEMAVSPGDVVAVWGAGPIGMLATAGPHPHRRVPDRTVVHPEVYGRAVTRTNIDIDDDLVFRVMRRFNLPSKRAAVDMALRRLLGEPMTRDEILALQGVGWSGDLDAIRRAEAGELG